ncbi:MAG TPA: hypothetical protein DCE41_20080 [Cytophagales bacterium]|nr:hypothetical protein [Cytophagales bacterium]HAA20297.1 hypothetical protein [Cytophagales bacterium]HAP63803.1 hypothetical protein [Cytophagales bacterium]
MAKFTITVEGDHLEQFVRNVLSQLGKHPEVEYTQEGNQFSFKTAQSSASENYMLPGPPMSWEELLAQLKSSETEYEAGEFLTTEQLKKDAESW